MIKNHNAICKIVLPKKLVIVTRVEALAKWGKKLAKNVTPQMA